VHGPPVAARNNTAAVRSESLQDSKELMTDQHLAAVATSRILMLVQVNSPCPLYILCSKRSRLDNDSKRGSSARL